MTLNRIADGGTPTTIPVVAAFIFAASAMAAVVGISLLAPSPFWNPLWNLNRPAYQAFEKLGTLPGFLFLVLSAVTAAAATGLLHRRRWAWWITVAIFSVNGCGDLVTLFVAHDLVRGGTGILIAGFFLFFLTRKRVRQALR
jgi:hypothetical protein